MLYDKKRYANPCSKWLDCIALGIEAFVGALAPLTSGGKRLPKARPDFLQR